MEKTVFTIGAFEDTTLEGFTKDEKWNGWACPYFDFEQAQMVSDTHKRFISNAWYDEKSDTFNFQMDKNDEEEIESYQPVEMEGRKFYPIGHSQWTWKEDNGKRFNRTGSGTA